ncbi:hypothetical protein AB0E08_04875 [Streptomyces sp. NPDC048281]|uniref:hypothetical protein n=1 Tax=Streptomyces sp. NPDC048281 TaxID=3154715 RepID=UPI0034311EE3
MPVDPWAIDTLAFSGLEARNVDSAFVMGNGSALGSQSGVRPGDPGLTVTLAGTTINCSAGVAVVAYAGQGVYRVALPTSVSPGTYTAAHATLNRLDLVYLRVWDNSVDASGLNKGDVVYLAGTPSASPVAPTPAGTQIYVPLATISVLSVSNGSTASVSTAVRPYTVAPGGILPSASTPTGLYVGQYWDDGTNLRRWNGTTWDTYQKVPLASTAWTPTWTTSTGLHSPSYGNATIDCRYYKLGRLVNFWMNIVFGSTTNFGASATTGDNWQFTLPATSAMLTYPVASVTYEAGTSRGVTGNAVTTSDGLNLQLNVSSAAVNSVALQAGVVDSLSPWTWASGNRLNVVGQYEAAS